MGRFKYKLPKTMVTTICKHLYAKGYRLGYTDDNRRVLFSGMEHSYLELTNEYQEGTKLSNCIFVNTKLKVYEFLLTDDTEDEDEVQFNFEDAEATERHYKELLPVFLKKGK